MGKKDGTEEEARSVTKMARWKMDKRVDDTTKEKKRVKRRRRGGGKRPAEKEKGRVNECRLHGGVMNDTSLGSHSSICPSSPLLPLLCPSFLPFPFFLNSSPSLLPALSSRFSCSSFFKSLLFLLPASSLLYYFLLLSLPSLPPHVCHLSHFILCFLYFVTLSSSISTSCLSYSSPLLILLFYFLLSFFPLLLLSSFLPPLLFPSLSPLYFLPPLLSTHFCNCFPVPPLSSFLFLPLLML